MIAYAELAVTTNFSFLRGISHPWEMVTAADELGLAAIGIADRNSFAGIVRAYDAWKTIEKKKIEEAKQTGAPKKETVKLLVGTRLVTIDGFEILAYPTDRAAYGRLCRLLTAGNRKTKKGEKGECLLTFEDILAANEVRCSSRYLRRNCRPSLSNGFQCLLAPRRNAPSSRARIAIAATNRAVSACWTDSAHASALHSSLSTTCIITLRSAGRLPMC